MIITAEQIRAARALIHLDQEELAREANLSVVTVRRLETPQGYERVAPATLDQVRKALERAGVEFIEGGVRRRHPERPDTRMLFEELRTISLRSAERLRGREQLTESDLYDDQGLPV